VVLVTVGAFLTSPGGIESCDPLQLYTSTRVNRPFSDEDSDNEDLCDTDSSDSDASGLSGRDHHLYKNLIHLYIRTASF